MLEQCGIIATGQSCWQGEGRCEAQSQGQSQGNTQAKGSTCTLTYYVVRYVCNEIERNIIMLCMMAMISCQPCKSFRLLVYLRSACLLGGSSLTCSCRRPHRFLGWTAMQQRMGLGFRKNGCRVCGHAGGLRVRSFVPGVGGEL